MKSGVRGRDKRIGKLADGVSGALVVACPVGIAVAQWTEIHADSTWSSGISGRATSGELLVGFGIGAACGLIALASAFVAKRSGATLMRNQQM